MCSFCFFEVIDIYSVKICESKRDINHYIEFIYEVYKNDPFFIDLPLFEMKSILLKKNKFSKNNLIESLMIYKEDKLCSVASLFKDINQSAILIGFLECLEDETKSIDEILSFAISFAKDYSLKNIIAGINGHVSLGVGYLNKSLNEPQSFDNRYTKTYYNDYFRKNKWLEETLHSYKAINSVITDMLESKNLDVSDLKVRYMNKSRFKHDLTILNELCNLSLSDTPYFTPMHKTQLYELIKPIKPWLKPYHLLFLMNDEKEIGFLFIPPDFHQTQKPMKKHSRLSIGLELIKNINKITALKINVIGSIEKNHKGLYKLLNEGMKISNKYYQTVETNFIFDRNISSTNLAKRLGLVEHTSYSIYKKVLEDA